MLSPFTGALDMTLTAAPTRPDGGSAPSARIGITLFREFGYRVRERPQLSL